MKQRNPSKLSGASMLALVGAMSAAMPALAQTAPATSAPVPAVVASADNSGGEIIVTARKRAENAINVPIAISSYSAKELARSGADGLRDLAAMTPGLTFQDVNGAYAAPTIRGIVQVDQTSLQGNVGVFIDGVYLNNRTGLEFGLLEVERIEIDKGPQSALYGRNTFAGAINYITVAPQLGKVAGNASVEVGDYGLQTYRGGVNVPIGDIAAIRVFGGYSKFDGTIKNERDGKNIGGFDGDQAYGASVLIKPTDRLTVKLFGSYSKINNSAEPLTQPSTGNNNCGSTTSHNGTAFNTLYCGKVSPVSSVNVDDGVSYGTRGTNKLAYATADYDLDFATLSATGTYDKGKYSNLIDTTANPLAITIPTSGGYSAQNFVQAATPNSSDKSIDIRLQSAKSSAVSYTVGFYGYNSNLTNTTAISHQLLNQPDSTPVVFSQSGGRLVSHGRAVYGALGYSPIEKMTLGAELRYTWEKQDFNGTGSQALYNGVPVAGKQNFHFFTPRFTANYAFAPEIVGYASAARGVKTGGFNSNAFGPAPDYFKYGMEKNWTYEAGVKTSLFDNTLRLTADVYHIDWTGIQGQRSVPGSILSVVTNQGAARSNGVEGDATYYFTRNLSLHATASYSDPRYKKGFIDGDLASPCGDYVGSSITSVGCSDDVSGKQLARTSKVQYAFSGNYDIPDIISGFDAYIRGDYSYQSGKYTTGNETQDQGSIKLLNGRVGVIHGPVEVAFFMKNIMNRKYNDRITQSPSTTDGSPASGVAYIRVYPGELRTLGVRADYRF